MYFNFNHSMQRAQCVTLLKCICCMLSPVTNYLVKGKGKVFPLQTRCGPEGG